MMRPMKTAPTFRALCEHLGSRTDAQRIAGIRNRLRAHRLYHGAAHTVPEIEAITRALCTPMKSAQK